MENVKIRCRSCGKEVEGASNKTVSCGCSNMATIVNNTRITANDLSLVVMITGYTQKVANNFLKNEDLMWQEERRRRKVKKLDFEIR